MGNESGEYIIDKLDEHGFNNPKGLHVPDKVQVAAIGSSIVEGATVPRDKNIVGWIREKYPPSLNFGKPGIGPFSEWAIFREYVMPIRPKVVLWVFLKMIKVYIQRIKIYLSQWLWVVFGMGRPGPLSRGESIMECSWLSIEEFIFFSNAFLSSPNFRLH